MKQSDRVRLAVLIGGVLLVGLAALFTHKRVNYLDYHTGRIRSQNSIFGAGYSSVIRPTWISEYADPDQSADWRLLGKSNTNPLFRRTWCTRAGLHLSQLTQLDTYIANAGADESSRQLVAEWVLELMSRSQSRIAASMSTEEAIDRFFDELPFPENSDNPLTYHQVWETIAKCEQAE